MGLAKSNGGKYFSKSGKPRRPIRCYGSVYPKGGGLFPQKCPNKATPGDIFCKKCKGKSLPR